MENAPVVTSIVDKERRRISIQGIVQGVGFRPFVYGQALHWSLVGFIFNDSQGVTIEVEGPLAALDGFMQALRENTPPLARVDSLSTEPVALRGETSFVIVHSQSGSQRHALISPDVATCHACLQELDDPTDRRYRYPFINCTDCGPRFTIVQDVPYDRDKTTMSVFPMCPDCRREYEDPLHRRFHAQPNACPVCGPQVAFVDEQGTTMSAETCPDPITFVAHLLVQGSIVAVKGLGGYHLACDARNAASVQRLRQRKRREARPFALMVQDLATAQLLCEINAEEADLLTSYRRPIVLLKQRLDCAVAPEVAPGSETLGIMLPYTPLHHLLLRACAEVAGEPVALVMTSGNLSDEPIAYQNSDAQRRLLSIAEGMLTHNREIHMRCDDSVARVTAAGRQIFRRSRGYAPEPIVLARNFPVPLLACGGHLKNVFCLGKGRQAFLSHHIGDLENLETLISFREGIEHFQRLFDLWPEAIAYDLHPEYLASKYALASPIARKIGVQHHHAHIGSVMAEHGLEGPVIGIAVDGTGYGTDGAIWGGEIMVADLLDFERCLHLDYIPLPGGEQAVRQPWRLAAVYLAHTYGDAFLNMDIPFVRQLDRTKWQILSQMIARGVNTPQTSSLGRLFDAVAALLDIRSEIRYEGQAAIELEIQAAACPEAVPGYVCTFRTSNTSTLDVRDLIRAIVQDRERGVPVPQIAMRFHISLAEMLAHACDEVRERSGLRQVVLGGGVFQNQLLLVELVKLLKKMAFDVYLNRQVPPNDGGLSLGQAAIAAARLRQA